MVQANKTRTSQQEKHCPELCVNRLHSTITRPVHNGSVINVWILPPTVNDENDIYNQLVVALC